MLCVHERRLFPQSSVTMSYIRRQVASITVICANLTLLSLLQRKGFFTSPSLYFNIFPGWPLGGLLKPRGKQFLMAKNHLPNMTRFGCFKIVMVQLPHLSFVCWHKKAMFTV